MFWERYNHDEIRVKVLEALDQNLDYRTEHILGLPATFLDREEFYDDAPFLKDAPFVRTLIDNPNHIGCHTLEEGEKAFAGTQEIERDLIRICAEEILGGKPNEQDGYVASGGTEGNIEAAWIYRNRFMREHGAKPGEIGLLFSEDTHYSLPKACDLLGLHPLIAPVNVQDRSIRLNSLQELLHGARKDSVKYLVVCLNMGTTMFGSVDDIDPIVELLDDGDWTYEIHVDAAFGGFIYPFTNSDNQLCFKNPRVTSVSLDAHKMLQAPYGTGVFLIRKGYMPFVCTEEAQYVRGKDYTLIGSRSGANAVAVWMILRSHGSEGWHLKISKLMDRCTSLCSRLDRAGIRYYREPLMNIVTISGSDIQDDIAQRFYLVPNTHDGEPEWWKIVVMDHVTQGGLDAFMSALEGAKNIVGRI
jgi:glutamate/tyrosine decarboxylase-like PLP-dependent enzyme